MLKKPIIIAEAGCNHKGDINIAHQMIKIASNFCNVDTIKFQKRCPKELLSQEAYNAPHPNPKNSYGKTYGEHREYLEFTKDQHYQLMKWCDEEHITYSTSVWDLTSAKEITELNPKLIKIPSACNNHYKMLEFLCKNYKGEIHLSFGMTTHLEEKNIIDLFKNNNRLKDLVVYNCTSGYPVPYEDICLLEINRLRKKFGNDVKAIGFSGHHLGKSIDIAAYTLGAEYIERHFTLNRNWKGTDHEASLEPEDMRLLVKNLNDVNMALQYKSSEILPIEKVQRDKLKYNK